MHEEPMCCLCCRRPVITEWVIIESRFERLHHHDLPTAGPYVTDVYDVAGEHVEIVDGDMVALLCLSCAPAVDAAVCSTVAGAIQSAAVA